MSIKVDLMVFGIWAYVNEADGRLTARSREDLKPRNSDSDFPNRSDIRQAHQQQHCRDACKFAER